MEEIGFFEKKGTMLLNIIKLFDTNVTSSYMASLQPLVSAGIGIYFLWMLVPFLIGSTKDSLEDVMIKVVTWTIVFAFAFNGGGYLEMVQNGMNEIFNWAGGGKEFFKNLDTWYKSLSLAGEKFYGMDDSDYVKVQGAIAQLIIIVGAFFLAVIPFLIIIASSMLMQIIVMLAPFLILSLVFPMVKTIFSNGLGLFLRVVFTMLIISILQKSFVAKINEFVTNATNAVEKGAEIDLIGSSILIFIMCIIYGGMLYSAVPISKVISGSISNIKVGSKSL